jgi:hypothetical protein
MITWDKKTIIGNDNVVSNVLVVYELRGKKSRYMRIQNAKPTKFKWVTDRCSRRQTPDKTYVWSLYTHKW